MRCILPLFQQDASLMQTYLTDLKEYLKKEKLLNKNNIEPFVKIHDELFFENGIFLEHCIGDGKLYIEGEEVGFLGDPTKVLMPPYLSLNGGSKSHRITYCKDCYREIRVNNTLPNRAQRLINRRALPYFTQASI